MYELSLFSGAGGGLLGSKLLGWIPIGYVEYDDYCQKIIAQRIKDGWLPVAPIFSDIRAFIAEGYADSYQGMVDVVTAGFPCQPFSVAGKQQGESDERNMWPQTIDVIRRVRPRFALLENVPGLFAHPYARRVFGDLAESGYDARWRVLSAAECGAPHKRDRVWIVADSDEMRKLQQERGKQNQRERVGDCGEDVANASSAGLERQQQPGRGDEAYTRPGDSCWWKTEPGVGRVANGVANRVDRIKALGNGQVPIVAATAWRLLND